MKYINEFTKAIHSLNKIKVTFKAKKYGNIEITRICAPMDYSLSKKYKDNIERYHFWDFQGTKGGHTESILEINIVSIEVLNDHFSPESFVTWKVPYNWSIKRDWGSKS